MYTYILKYCVSLTFHRPEMKFTKSKAGHKLRACPAKTKAWVAKHHTKALNKEMIPRTLKFYFVKGPVHNLEKKLQETLHSPVTSAGKCNSPS